MTVRAPKEEKAWAVVSCPKKYDCVVVRRRWRRMMLGAMVRSGVGEGEVLLAKQNGWAKCCLSVQLACKNMQQHI